jgi:hypothetical protein
VTRAEVVNLPRVPSETVVVALLATIGVVVLRLWGVLGIVILFAVLGTIAAGMWGFILYCRWKTAELLADQSTDFREAYLDNLDPDSRDQIERDLLRFFHI